MTASGPVSVVRLCEEHISETVWSFLRNLPHLDSKTAKRLRTNDTMSISSFSHNACARTCACRAVVVDLFTGMQATLLALRFADAMDARTYVRYLILQIKEYLRTTSMRKDCVIVIAVLHRSQDSNGSGQDAEGGAHAGSAWGW
jgi:hypothetical protein